MATSSTQNAKFTQGNLLRHVTVMSLTASLGLMAIFLVDLVDLIFISMLGKAELAAAVGYAGGVLFFTSSLGIGMSIAAGAVVSRAIGENDRETGQRRATTALFYAVVMSSILALVLWLNRAGLAASLGAEGETLALASGYLAIILPSLPILVVAMVGGAILRANGDAKFAMYATLGGGAVNAILDPILIFGLGLDLTGAALASVAARITIAFLSLRPIIRNYGGFVRPSASELRADFPVLFKIAVPAILTQFATPFGQAFVTRSMAEYGEEAVAGMAIIGRLIPVAFGVLFALSGAVGPIIGQNLGAGKFDRVKGAFQAAILFVAVVIVLMTGILFVARPYLADLFIATGITRELLYLFCGPLALLFFFNGLIFIGNAAFNNLGRPFYSTWINWGRHSIGTIPFVIIGGQYWGAKGVMIGQAIGGVFFGALAVLIVLRVISNAGQEPAVARSDFKRQIRLLQLFNFHR
ncbi:MAG: MATE family efflux transporter [Halocynthiibacter sp.]